MGSERRAPVRSAMSSNMPMMNPMSRLPSVLTNSVPNGKLLPNTAPMLVVLR